MQRKRMLESNEKTKQLWQEFVTTWKVDRDEVRGIIADSWIRSHNAGVDPHAVLITQEVPADRLVEMEQSFSEILDIARPFMQTIYETVGNDGMFVRLTNAEGYVVECLGDEQVYTLDIAQFFYRGKNVREENIGTNAIGLSLRKNIPVQVLGAEHYRESYHDLTTSAAPIRDESGKVLAILSMTGDYRHVHPHTLGMVMASALAIEHEMNLKRTNQSLERVIDHQKAIMKSIKEGIMTIDAHGIITDANQFAAEFMNAQADDIVGRHISEFVTKNYSKRFINEDGLEEVEVHLNRTGGPKRFVIFNTLPIHADDGAVKEYLITFRESKKVYSQANKIFGSKAIYTFDDILGDSQEIHEAIRIAKLVSDSEATILLFGESGTGKELFAQSIHNASSRANHSFVFINCGAIPRDLVASELFGYVEGAFTGARKGGNPGKFELADGGTLFLDEIGDMPLDTQANLLRVLETKEVVRVGGHEVIPVDVRVVAATHKDLKEEVERGNFRSDLFYRLNVMPVHTPALRERKEDIRVLVDRFYRQFSPNHSRKVLIDESFYRIMREYHWPGNVRELQNVMQMVCNIVQPDDKLTSQHLPSYIKEKLNMVVSEEIRVLKPLYMIEKETIQQALKIANGNLVQTAKMLEIGRSTLYRKMEKYGIEM